MKLGRPPYSYGPTRQSLLEILNVDAGPLGVVPRASWSQIAEEVAKRSRTDDEEAANLAVAHALYGFADAHAIVGQRHEFFP